MEITNDILEKILDNSYYELESNNEFKIYTTRQDLESKIYIVKELITRKQIVHKEVNIPVLIRIDSAKLDIDLFIKRFKEALTAIVNYKFIEDLKK
jgi:hypothetical protein